MRLATIRTATGTRAVRLDGDRAVGTGHSDEAVAEAAIAGLGECRSTCVAEKRA
jgi:hypothetical protein